MTWPWLVAAPGFSIAACWLDAGTGFPTRVHERVVITHAWVSMSLYGLSIAVVVGLLIRRLRRPSAAPHPAFTLLAGAVALVCPGALWILVGAPWSQIDRVTAPDGRDYALLHWGLMMASQDALGRVTNDGSASTTYEVIDVADGGSPGDDRYAAVVRPAGAIDSGHAVFLSAAGLVVAATGRRCYLAASLVGTRETGAEAILELPPFVLVDAAGTGEERDVEGLCADVRDRAARTMATPTARDRFGIPTESSLLAALDSPNAWVRGAAKRIVEAGGAAIYPDATKRLAAVPK